MQVPVYAQVKVHRDYHVQVGKALYSIPEHLRGQTISARADSELVKMYHRGQLVKTHPRQPPGGRSTDPADLPADKAGYAMRDLDRLIATAAGHGPNIGIYAERLLDHDLPWTRMRQVYRLLGLVKRYGADPVDTACGRALDLDVVSVTKIAAMLEKATENTPAPPPRAASGLAPARFARDPREYRPSVQGDQAGLDERHRRRRPGRLQPGPGGAVVTKPTKDVVTDPISPDLKKVMRQLKLGRMLDTLPERLTLARQQHLSHAAFLELVLADEATRRDTSSAARRARAAGLDPTMRLEHLGRDRGRALRPHPVDRPDQPAVPRRPPRRLDPGRGRGRQNAPGHRAGPYRRAPPRPHPDAARRRNVQAAQSIPPRQQHRSRDAPPRPSPAAHYRRLRAAAHGRHRDRRLLRTGRGPPPRKPPPCVTSNRGPDEWLAIMADPLLAQSAVDRLTSTAHELVIEGQSYRRRQKPSVDTSRTTTDHPH